MKILKSGSSGNAVMYNDIMVDCGVPYKMVKNESINLILLTHEHSDHINPSTLKHLILDHPNITIAAPVYYPEHLLPDSNVIRIKLDTNYTFNKSVFKAFQLMHDVPNCGYKIFTNGQKIIHATDTGNLIGLEAKNYDIYAIESNYMQSDIYNIIDEKKAKGEFIHEYRKIDYHLSEEDCVSFFDKNKKEGSKLVRLHQ